MRPLTTDEKDHVLKKALVYYNFFSLPYNGNWKTVIHGRLIILELKNGEGRLKINRDTIPNNATDLFDVVVYEKHKDDTTIGIDGQTHKIRTNGSVLVLELNELYTEMGLLDNDLYFTKIK